MKEIGEELVWQIIKKGLIIGSVIGLILASIICIILYIL